MQFRSRKVDHNCAVLDTPDLNFWGVRTPKTPTVAAAAAAADCDVVCAYSAHEAIDSKFRTDVKVMSNGRCEWKPLGIFISSCAIDIRWFPFDDQRCKMKFGSWTYDSTKLNLTATSASTISNKVYMPSSEWDLVGNRTLRIRDSLPTPIGFHL